MEAREVMATRRALFRLMSNAIGPIDAITKKRRPYDRDLVALSAYRLLQFSTMIGDAYSLDTRRWTKPEDANSRIWTRSGKFDRAIDELSDASRALLQAAARGNEIEVWEEAARVNRSCLECHREFATRVYEYGLDKR